MLWHESYLEIKTGCSCMRIINLPSRVSYKKVNIRMQFNVLSVFFLLKFIRVRVIFSHFSYIIDRRHTELEIHIPRYTQLKLQVYHISQIMVSHEHCRRGADKSLTRPTSRCRRTGLILSLERGVCSRAELHVFSCYVLLLCFVQRLKLSTSGDLSGFIKCGEFLD